MGIPARNSLRGIRMLWPQCRTQTARDCEPDRRCETTLLTDEICLRGAAMGVPARVQAPQRLLVAPVALAQQMAVHISLSGAPGKIVQSLRGACPSRRTSLGDNSGAGTTAWRKMRPHPGPAPLNSALGPASFPSCRSDSDRQSFYQSFSPAGDTCKLPSLPVDDNGHTDSQMLSLLLQIFSEGFEVGTGTAYRLHAFTGEG